MSTAGHENKRRRVESLSIGLVGFGSIGQVIAGSLKSGEIPGVSLSAVIVQRERSERPPELGSALLTTNIKDRWVFYCVFVCFDVIVSKSCFFTSVLSVRFSLFEVIIWEDDPHLQR